MILVSRSWHRCTVDAAIAPTIATIAGTSRNEGSCCSAHVSALKWRFIERKFRAAGIAARRE
jgi:hypothetical protein